MRSRHLYMIAFCWLITLQSHAQSTAFKLLLDTFYDKEFPTISPKGVSNLKNPLILDTREWNEFQTSHIKNAHYVGYNNFDISTIQEKDKSRPIIVYCSIGVRSQDIGKKLQEAGYVNVYNLYGGIFHWVNEENTVYKDDQPTKKVHAYNRAWGIWLNKGEKVYGD
ncbi:rhodanese-like domain-containing protein [Mongoliitalea daihaiensis]|uniref:rhodanese-like domain-containing protein n=1 Tax=Mongoliitalea daihaiensis TaxID=2782006 RepID=UPI001F32A56C|nr:rhodanese-like domain-containing protein [Mongoliitalea daihaiensis]UJP64775.1 rhodanese-like domain-containing protein [Mongoliitalea daihaiensis]